MSDPGRAEAETAATGGHDQLKVEVERVGGAPVISVVGELDPHTAPLLERAIDEALDERGTQLVLDLSGLDFVDSSGLRVLVAAENQLAEQGGTLALRSPSVTVRRLLEITGLADHLTLTEG